MFFDIGINFFILQFQSLFSTGNISLQNFSHKTYPIDQIIEQGKLVPDTLRQAIFVYGIIRNAVLVDILFLLIPYSIKVVGLSFLFEFPCTFIPFRHFRKEQTPILLCWQRFHSYKQAHIPSQTPFSARRHD